MAEFFNRISPLPPLPFKVVYASLSGMTEEELNAKALNDVNTYGCHVLMIQSEGNMPPFAYSIGIGATSHQPDLLVIGLNLHVGHWIINEYNRRVRGGEIFLPNVPYDGFIEEFPVFFSPMLKQHYPEYLGWGRWLYRGDNFRMFQLIYPDTSGRWLWEATADDSYRRLMPLLSDQPSYTGP